MIGDFPVTAKHMIGRVLRQSTGHRVQMNVKHHPIQIPLLANRLRLVPALP